MSRLDHVKRFHLLLADLEERLGGAIRLAGRIGPERLDDLSAGWGVVLCGQAGQRQGCQRKMPLASSETWEEAPSVHCEDEGGDFGCRMGM